MAMAPKEASQRYFRYYLFAEGKLWKIPAKLHTALVKAELKLPKFASSQQKILEVEISKIPTVRVIDMRGTVYSFDSAGRLELSAQAEAAGLEIQGSTPVKTTGVVDIGPLLRDRHWQRTRTWAPTDVIKTLVKTNIESHEASSRIHILKKR